MQTSMADLAGSLRSTQVLNGTTLVGHDVLAPADHGHHRSRAARCTGAVDVPKGATACRSREGRSRRSSCAASRCAPPSGLNEFHVGRHRRRGQSPCPPASTTSRSSRTSAARPVARPAARQQGRERHHRPDERLAHPQYQHRAPWPSATSAASSNAPNTFPGDSSMPFRLALSGLNAASTDLTVTANNIANVATDGLQGIARRVRGPVRHLPAGRQRHRHRQRRARLERLAAVLPGQHRLHGQQPRPRDQRPGLLRAERQRRAQLHARRRVPGEQRGLRRERASSSACRCIRRSPTAASTRAACRI